MPPHPPSPSVRLRPATQADIPRLANIFVRAFRPSPWSAVLFPPHLRSSSSVSKRENNGHDNPKVSDDDNIDDYKDELNWRERLFTADLAKPGRRCILAVQSTVPATESTTEGRDDGGRPVIAEMQRENGNGAQEETILGWASWVDEPIYAPSNASSSSTSSTVPGPQEPTAEQIAAERERTWGSLHPPGLDVVAFEDLSKKGKGVEAFAKKALVGEGGGWVDAVELHYLVIDPTHQRKGIGHLLLRDGLAWVAASSSSSSSNNNNITKKPVWLRSTRQGRPLYRSLGFEQVGPSGGICVVGDKQYPMVYRP